MPVEIKMFDSSYKGEKRIEDGKEITDIGFFVDSLPSRTPVEPFSPRRYQTPKGRYIIEPKVQVKTSGIVLADKSGKGVSHEIIREEFEKEGLSIVIFHEGSAYLGKIQHVPTKPSTLSKSTGAA